ncbi:MAG: hypothetical protein KBD46_01595 [Candidatus Levybacteria bacterium]|nr:hypothetical protein [Candidatus Levybacteria bacterium]
MKIKLSIVFLAIIQFFLLPRVIFGAMQDCLENQGYVDGIGCVPTDTGGFVSQFYGIGLGLIGGVSILFIILGGYFILMSQGDPSKLAIGRSYITYAVIGLLLAIFGFIFTTVIAVDILRIPGFN